MLNILIYRTLKTESYIGSNFINQHIMDYLVRPFMETSRHNIVKRKVFDLTGIGRRVGWVPEHFPCSFFSDRVDQEIALAKVASINEIHANEQDVRLAYTLLTQLNLDHLAEKNPLFLSEGEKKQVGFLCQLVKEPEYLIFSHF